MKFVSSWLSSLLLCAVTGMEISNGDFEIPDGTSKESASYIKPVAQDWTVFLNSGKQKCDAALSDDAFSGKKSLLFSTTALNAFVSAQRDIAVTPNTEITASVMVKSPDGMKGYFRVYFYDKTGKINRKNYLMHGRGGNPKWEQLVFKFKVPAEATKMLFCIQTMANKKNGAIQFDHFTLRQEAGAVLANANVRAELNPFFGGGIDRLELRSSKRDASFTLPRTMNADGGMALEIIPSKPNPGAFSHKKYEIKVVTPSQKITAERTENELKVGKTYTLFPDSNQIQVELKFTNTGKKAMDVDCRIHNILKAAEGFFTSPTRDWLQSFKRDAESFKVSMNLTSNNLQSNWLSKVSGDSGVVIGFDPKVYRTGFSYLGSKVETMEWYLIPIKLEPGKKWSTIYTINLIPTGNPVVGFDGVNVYSVDSLEQPKKMVITAVVPNQLKGVFNDRPLNLILKAGESHAEPLATPDFKFQTNNFSVVFGKKYNYAPMFIKGVKLPEPPKKSIHPTLEGFFPFAINTPALVFPEATGMTGGMKMYLRNAETLMREGAAGHFNLFMSLKCTQEPMISAGKLPAGKHLLGELARQYRMKLVGNIPLFSKNDTDSKAFRPKLESALQRLLTPAHLELIRTYPELYYMFYTGDETTAQNISCMLEAHEKLAELVPNIPAAPYLNIHTRVYTPYVPVFIGDWYPVNRKSHGGRNPWNVVRVVAETVAIAGETPVHLMPQGFGYFKSGYGFPTAAEGLMMLHLAVANGAKGIIIHEIVNRGISWRYNYGYHYATRGGAGELTPLWFAYSKAARELTAIGPQAVVAAPEKLPSWITVDSPHFRSANGYYDDAQLKAYSLRQRTDKGGARIVVAVNHSDIAKSNGAITFAVPVGEKVYSLTRMVPVPAGKPWKLELDPGDAEYFAVGSSDAVGRIAKEVERERLKREQVAFRIAADRAAKNGVDIVPALKLAEAGTLEKLREAEQNLKKLVDQTEFGKFEKEWNRTRMTLSDISFLFQTHWDLVMPPHLRAATKRYARYNNTDDPEMQKLVDRIAECWKEYWRIEQKIVDGDFAAERQKGEALIRKAAADAKAAESYLKKNAHKIKVDDPYSE